MAEHTLKLQPFRVPNYVLYEMPTRPRQEGIADTPKIALEDLDDYTLNTLCDEFRANVFAKARKGEPQ